MLEAQEIRRPATKKVSTAATKAGQKISPQKLTIGLDLGDRSSWYCVLDETGEVILEQRMSTTAKAMQEVFGAMPRSRIALETGMHSPWISRLLTALGHEVIVAHARRVRLIGESRKKDDRMDARTLARLARIDPQLLCPVKHRSAKAQADLTLIRARAGLVRARTALVNRPGDWPRATARNLLSTLASKGKPATRQAGLNRRADNLRSMQRHKTCMSDIPRTTRFMRVIPDGANFPMNALNSRVLISIVVFLAVSGLFAQNTAQPTYMNQTLSPQQRAEDLVHRMTVEEKVTQLVNQSRAVPRLNVPDYDWWSESLHGVARSGTTEFPEPVGLAATFDTDAIHRMAIVIGTEGRASHVRGMRDGHSDIFEGLDFWAPNINIFRDPRWGRGQETYGEDPFLTARMGVAFVTGLQGDDPKYYRAISTPKHYAVHSGPESTRHTADVKVSKHDEVDTYLPAFRATVTEGNAGSVMCAYNSINGQPACVNEFLLQNQLRGKWGFQGYVVSDCEAVINIFRDHHFTKTQPEASALAVQRGMDNECVDFAKVKDDHDYKPYLDAYKQGFLKETEIDTALIRLFTARMKLGLFDPPEIVPYSKIDEKEFDTPEHRAMARVLANESMVLLKNDGILPLKPGSLKIALIGPLADQTKYLLGNYNGVPTHTVSVLEGLKAEFPEAQISFFPGTQFLRNDGDAVPASAFTTSDGQPGLKLEFATGEIFGGKPTILATRVVTTVDLKAGDIPQAATGKYPMRADWNGFLTPTETGDYSIGVRFQAGFAKVSVNDRPVAQGWGSADDVGEAKVGHVHLEQGKKLSIKVEYSKPDAGPIRAQLIWSKYDSRPSPEAIAAAKDADVVVAVLGITSELEGEEMPVSEEGFKGGDRTSIDLPKPEEDLLEAVTAPGKPVVLVLANGSALAVNWAREHTNAILESWYAGEEGGAAIAETLSGKNNPAGRLPVTFYTGVEQLPPFEDYAMKGRTYRYFEGKPLYPFGYGLSYTTFSYSGLTLPMSAIKAGDPLTAEVTVTNTGKREGDEVAQLYLAFPHVAGAPLRALRGFKRVHLKPGESQTMQFKLRDRDLSMVSEDGAQIIAKGKYSVSVGGGQPNTESPSVSRTFQVRGFKTFLE